MISNGEIGVAAAAASAVAIAAFGSGAPKSQPAMIIVVPATTQTAATRVILRIANLLPRPVSACRNADKREFYSPDLPWIGVFQLAHDEPGAATRPVSYFTVEKIFSGGSGNLARASCGISSRLAHSGGSDAEAP
jgi:hypothetical protein